MTKFNISIKQTSHSSIVKFEANHALVEHCNYEYANIDEAENSPLAQQLFYLPFVRTIYISGNFIAIEKYDIVAWEDIRDEVAVQIEKYLNTGQPVVVNTEVPNKKAVTVYAESTPNPKVMKFVVSKKLVALPFEFKSIDDAKNAPLAKSLFHFPFVKEVFFDENYIAVTKYDLADWNEITVELRTYIRDFIADGKEWILAESIAEKTKTSDRLDEDQAHLDETSKQIIAILDEYVKPAVASDGGNIMFDSYDIEEKIVKVVLQGACSGCPSSTFTLKNGIENMLKSMLSDKVERVIALNG